MENSQFFKKDIYLIMLLTLFLIAGCMFLRVSLVYVFFSSIIITSLIMINRGLSWQEIWQMIWAGLVECKRLYLLILLIGATVSIWLSSGIVPTMIYYGFQYMKGMNFLLSAFLITSLMSVFMGTAVGTISTIGIALLGIGKGFGVPEGVLLGTIVSGAFIADKISPISGLLNLTLATTKIKYKQALHSMLYTLIPVYFVTALIYYFIGRVYTVSAELSHLAQYQQAIWEGFYISPWLLLLPLGVICLSILGVKIIKTISLGLVGGILVSGIVQKMAVWDVFRAIFYGYQGNTLSPELNQILLSGGVLGMVEVVFIVASAISLSSILEKTGMIKPLVSRSISGARTQGQVVLKTALISSSLTILTCDQTVGIILPGRLFRERYTQLGLGQELLARTISDTGTIIAPLFPWNVNALIIGMIAGVSALDYAPYAVLCYLFPVMTVLISSLSGNRSMLAKSAVTP